MCFLPNKKIEFKIRNRLRNFFNTQKINFRHNLEPAWTSLTGSLAFFCLLLIIFYNPITIIAQSVFSLTFSSGSVPEIEKRYTFIPGSAPNRFDEIDLQNLYMLSFYDLPFDNDGSFIKEAYGYDSIHSDSTSLLFQKARTRNIKTMATITQTYSPDIYDFLNNPDAQQKLYKNSTQLINEARIDGITVNIELMEKVNPYYRNKFSYFIKNFVQHLRQNSPDAILSVAIPGNIRKDNIYDLKTIAQESDNILIIAYDFPVGETNNSQGISPIFGNNHDEYELVINKTIALFHHDVPHEKLVMERAWYGNGHNYPLYSSDYKNKKSDPTINTLSAVLPPYTMERLISDVPTGARASVRKNLPYIIKALENENILNTNVLAYALATIQHETANTFEPISEFKGPKSARRLGYEGGTNYYGRGFIQLTHLRNYKNFGERIGLGDKLVSDPELASRPDIAAQILAAYFKDFGIAKLATDGNFIDARYLINPDNKGFSIAEIAYLYLNAFV